MMYLTRSEADTASFAARLAQMLAPGDTVLLRGDLGVGKSVIARGIARALGVQGAMPSPTFTLMIPHEGKNVRIYHFDLYRLNDPDEYYAAGLDEFMGGEGVALVEWPEMAEINPRPALELRIGRAADEEQRRIEIENFGVKGFDAGALVEWSVTA